MTNRLRIGHLFGQPGFYISQPGDDVNAPTQALALDTRYETMDIHHYGRRRYNREVISSLNTTFFTSFGEEQFPALGYEPIYMFTTVRVADGNWVSYPQGIYSTGTAFPQNFIFELRGNRIWTTFEILNTSAPVYDFVYVIFKNRWV